MDCPDTRAPWGGVCSTCGETLPSEKFQPTWRASKIDASASERARASSAAGTEFRRRWSPNGQTTPKATSHHRPRTTMTEAQLVAERKSSARYYTSHREQVLQRKREAYAASEGSQR